MVQNVFLLNMNIRFWIILWILQHFEYFTDIYMHLKTLQKCSSEAKVRYWTKWPSEIEPNRLSIGKAASLAVMASQWAQHTESWAGLSSPEVPLWIIDKGQCCHASLSAFGITQDDPDAHAQCPGSTRWASASTQILADNRFDQIFNVVSPYINN